MKAIKILEPVKPGYSVHLTAKERAFMETVERRFPSQEVILGARQRTGLRASICVGEGKQYPCLVAYRLSQRGEPHGMSQVIYLADGMSEADAFAFLNSFDGKGF